MCTEIIPWGARQKLSYTTAQQLDGQVLHIHQVSRQEARRAQWTWRCRRNENHGHLLVPSMPRYCRLAAEPSAPQATPDNVNKPGVRETRHARFVTAHPRLRRLHGVGHARAPNGQILLWWHKTKQPSEAVPKLSARQQYPATISAAKKKCHARPPVPLHTVATQGHRGIAKRRTSP